MLNVNLLADVWSWLVPAVIMVVYLISHLWSASQGPAKQQQPRPNQQRRRQPQGERALPSQGEKAGEKQAGNQSQLNAEIDEFLKRANQRKQDKSRRETAPRSAPFAQPKVEKPVEATTSERRGFDSVATSVSEHMSNRAFDERASHLADDIKRSEQGLARHLESAFDQRVGTLGAASDVKRLSTEGKPVVAPERPAAAQAMAGLLINPQTIRQAVLMKEILERPVDRW